MEHAEQLALADRLFHYIDERLTAAADEVYAQPVAEYVDPAVAAQEQTQFFRRGPLCLGMSGLLPEPGSYVTHDLSGQPLLLTRAPDGEFRAFLNVCRHRGARVAEGCGRQNAFSCPYHAWRYGLDGRLIARPEDAAFRAVPKGDNGLVPVSAAERDGLLWVVPEAGGRLDVDKHLGALGSEVATFGLADFHHYDSRVLRRRMNWKLVVDTFLESYHFCVLHKDSICSIFYDNLTTFDAYGDHFRITSARRTIDEMRGRPRAEWDLLPHLVGIYVLFPNTVLVWQLDHVELWQIFPGEDAPEDAVIHLSLYAPEPAVTESARRHWDKNLELVVHVVENEDFPVGEGIQKSFHSGAQDHIVFGTNEPALTYYHRAITAALAAGA
ncbi:MAG: aromatic ring-hydroxylating oxygenase subunit alpha [Gammaproteobacteria bacterium]